MDLTTLVIIAFVLVIAYDIAMAIARHMVYGKLEQMFAAGSYQEVLDYLDKRSVTSALPKYNAAYVRLNAYLALDDKKRAKEMFSELLGMHVYKQQRADLVVKAFQFYLGEGMYKDAGKLLEEIESNSVFPEGTRKQSRQAYDILAKKESSHIDEMEEEIKEATGLRACELANFLSIQYGYIGDKQRSAEWKKRFDDLVADYVQSSAGSHPHKNQ